MLMDSAGHEIRKGTVGITYFCSMISGPSAGKTWITGGIWNVISATREQDSQKPSKIRRYCNCTLPLNGKISKEFVAMFLKLPHPLFSSLSPCMLPRWAWNFLYSAGIGVGKEKEKRAALLSYCRGTRSHASGWGNIKGLTSNRFRVLIIIKSRMF